MVKNRLKQIRTSAGLTQRQVYRAAGLAASTYYQYEHGQTLPRAELRLRLARALGAPESALWPDGGQREAADPPDRSAGAQRSDAASLRRAANVRVGDRLVRRLPAGATRAEIVPCTVVETGPRFFTVRWNRSGARECWPYQEMLASNPELRRANR